MISNRESKFIKSLQLKKFRNLENRFVVEGEKSVLELLSSDIGIDSLYVTSQFAERQQLLLANLKINYTLVESKDLERIGTFLTNNAALAVARIPEIGALKSLDRSVLAFDRIKDPGNLGTVIRIADWYGFNDIVCSPDSVDCYNAKVIASSMGSFARVTVHYQDLSEFLDGCPYVYGAALGGDNLHEVMFKEPAVLLFGNESQGLSASVQNKASRLVEIRGFGGAESLNVAVSTAVFCDNFRRILGNS